MATIDDCWKIIQGSIEKNVEVSQECFDLVGTEIPPQSSQEILDSLGIKPVENLENNRTTEVVEPPIRSVFIPEEVETKEEKKQTTQQGSPKGKSEESQKEEKPKIYIPNFAYPFKRISKHDKTKSTYDLMMENLFKDKETQYLFNSSGLFHGGVHLNGMKFCQTTFDTDSIRAIADGKVIAYRIDKEPLENQLNDETVRYTTSFFLLEHKMEYPVGNKLTFYSLYMHMASMDMYEFTTYVLCGSKEYVKEGSSKGLGISNTFGKEVTLTGEKVGDRFILETLDGKELAKKLVVHKSNLMKKEDLHTTTTKGTGINIRYHETDCESWKDLKIAIDELKKGVSIVVGSKKLKCNRYEVISIDGKFIVEYNDKEDKTKKIEKMVSISASNLTVVPKISKNTKDTSKNGLVSKKMKTDQVVELEGEEQIEVKAGEVLGKLGLYSQEWIEEPVVHLEVFTFDDVEKFQCDATKEYEEEIEHEVGGTKETPIVKGWRNTGSVPLDDKTTDIQYIAKGTPIKLKSEKKSVGKYIKQQVIEVDGSNELVKEGEWTIAMKQVVVKDEHKEKPKPNILYVPKETTELFEKGYDDSIYAKVTSNTNIRKGTTNEGKIYKGASTKKGTELVLGTTTTETKVPKTDKKEAHSYYRQSVLEIAGKKVDGYTVHTDYFEIIEKDVFVPKETDKKLQSPVIKPIKNLKIEKDKEGIEYIQVATNPNLYVKKYQDKEQVSQWFTHGVTLKMFEVMKQEGNDNIGIFDDTVSFYDTRESNAKTQEEREKLNPLFKEVLEKLKIDSDKDGKLEAGELAGLTLTQAKQKEASYIVAKHESEWENPKRYEKLATFLEELNTTEYAEMLRDRTKKLSFFDDVMALDFSPTFFHPIALVGAMVGECEKKVFDWSQTPLVKLIISHESRGYYTAYNISKKVKKKDKHGNFIYKAGKLVYRWAVFKSNYKVGDDKFFSFDITTMTVQEIQDAQKLDYRPFPHEHLLAVGLYQMLPNPLKEALVWLKKYISINESTQLFDQNFQDMMPLFFWDSKRGGVIGKYFKGKVSVEDTAYQISKEWASAGVPKGYTTASGKKSSGFKETYYDKRPGNKAHYSASATIKALKKTKNIIDSYGGYDLIKEQTFSSNKECNEEIEKVEEDLSTKAWIFDRDKWTFTSHDGNVKYSQVYAGAPNYKNKSKSENLKDKGPIPKGLWKIIGKRDKLHDRRHSNVLVLSPEEGTETYGRSGFLIHGDNPTASGSIGCIIVNGKNNRLNIFNSDIKYILVK